MQISEKIEKLKNISINEARPDIVYETISKCNLIKTDYSTYIMTHPINCDLELLRLQTANYDLCCALLTMLIREDYWCNGAFEKHINNGDVKRVIDKLISILEPLNSTQIKEFSEKTLATISGYYVYALIDPRTNEVFYIGKGTGNRVFSHKADCQKTSESEKEKILKIRDIEKDGFSVKRIMINWGLSEQEAFVAEAALINLFDLISDNGLTNIVAGQHVHECLTVENFELQYGAEPLKIEEIKHNILVIKINKLYRRNMTNFEIYDAVRGMWRVSVKSIKLRKIRYVFAVYNGLVVGVYKPDEWHYVHEKIDLPQRNEIDEETFDKLKDRAYFICKKYDDLDDEGRFYLRKSISELKVNKSAQNPISYLMTKT